MLRNMRPYLLLRSCAGLLAIVGLMAAVPCFAQGNASTTATAYQAKLQEYTAARRAFDEEAAVYWSSISEKRRGRNAKRRSGQDITLDDYVITQPPVYRGPPRPVDPTETAPMRAPTEPQKPPIPVAA